MSQGRCAKKMTVTKEVEPVVTFENWVTSAASCMLEALRSLGVDVATDKNFKDTPRRVAKAWKEMLSGVGQQKEEVQKILSATFPSDANDMITVGPVNTWSVCPHHLLPVQLKIWLGYIPDKRVLGLSKLARLAEVVARSPALQEDVTQDIAGYLFAGLHPKGAACHVRGYHLCMAVRGVKQSAWTTTTCLHGVFAQHEVRSEFLAAVWAAQNGR